MGKEVYFTRPGSNSEVFERLKLDIKYAKQRVYISEYYLTDDELREIFHECSVQKLAVLNSRAHYNPNPHVVFLGNPKQNKSSCMHHKFVIADDIVWTGSFNLSKNAADNNWEHMIRFSDKDILKVFLSEFKRMYILGKSLGKQRIDNRTCVCGSHEIVDPYQNLQPIFLNVNVKVFKCDRDTSGKLLIDWDTEGYLDDIRLTQSIEFEHPSPMATVICREVANVLEYNSEVRCEQCKDRVQPNSVCVFNEPSPRNLRVGLDYKATQRELGDNYNYLVSSERYRDLLDDPYTYGDPAGYSVSPDRLSSDWTSAKAVFRFNDNLALEFGGEVNITSIENGRFYCYTCMFDILNDKGLLDREMFYLPAQKTPGI